MGSVNVALWCLAKIFSTIRVHATLTKKEKALRRLSTATDTKIWKTKYKLKALSSFSFSDLFNILRQLRLSTENHGEAIIKALDNSFWWIDVLPWQTNDAGDSPGWTLAVIKTTFCLSPFTLFSGLVIVNKSTRLCCWKKSSNFYGKRSNNTNVWAKLCS